jgi:allantoin racemase
MKIWHQSLAPLDGFGLYRDVLQRHIIQAASIDTTVSLHGLPARAYAGNAPATVLRYPYLRHLVHREVIEACISAESQEFDAVTFASFGEPFLTECRSVVDIPVVSAAEATLLVGCSMGRRIALITLTPRGVSRLMDIALAHGLTERVIVRGLRPAVSEGDLLELLDTGDPGPFLDSFNQAAAAAIADGADLIIPAEGVLNEVLHLHGLRHVGRVSVMDIIAVAFAYTEMLAGLQRRTGLTVGREWSYPKPPVELLEAVRDNSRLGVHE